MPVHDWALVEAGIFHDFHTVWIGVIRTALNDGLLPRGYYALAEQHFGSPIADVLTLHSSTSPPEGLHSLPADTGGIAVAEVPPRTSRQHTVEASVLARRRSLAIRHVSGHRLVALLEIVSPANKDRTESVEVFVDKAIGALDLGVHLLLVDLFAQGAFDPRGMHGAVLERLEQSGDNYDFPSTEPLTLASYAAGPRVQIYSEHLRVGMPLPDMPLFLRPDRYVNAPLERTYQEAYRGLPAYWRDVLEGRPPEDV